MTKVKAGDKNVILGCVDAFIYLSSQHPKLFFVHQLKIKGQIWASDKLIRYLILFLLLLLLLLVNMKKDALPLQRVG